MAGENITSRGTKVVAVDDEESQSAKSSGVGNRSCTSLTACTSIGTSDALEENPTRRKRKTLTLALAIAWAFFFVSVVVALAVIFSNKGAKAGQDRSVLTSSTASINYQALVEWKSVNTEDGWITYDTGYEMTDPISMSLGETKVLPEGNVTLKLLSARTQDQKEVVEMTVVVTFHCCTHSWNVTAEVSESPLLSHSAWTSQDTCDCPQISHSIQARAAISGA